MAAKKQINDGKWLFNWLRFLCSKLKYMWHRLLCHSLVRSELYRQWQ